MNLDQQHSLLSRIRSKVFDRLFGAKPVARYGHAEFDREAGGVEIDVFVYDLGKDEKGLPHYAAVTSGMSDHRLEDAETGESARIELIQYFRNCEPEDVNRLFEAAYIPHHDQFLLLVGDTISWPSHDDEEGSFGDRFPHSFFLRPPIEGHHDLKLVIEEEMVSLLWHIPISDEEFALKRQHGAQALTQRMDAATFPWITDHRNRPSLVPSRPMRIC